MLILKIAPNVLSIIFLLLWGTSVLAAPSAKNIVEASGIKGGLVVHVGCGNGRLTADLRVNDSFLVHGLDTDAQNVDRARQQLCSRGLYGVVSISTFDGINLPYVDNLVNLLIASDIGTVSMAEVMRVLAPYGVAMIGDRRIVKPWPEVIDEWSHYLHGPDNNAVAEDLVAGPPRHMQWLAEPKWTRHHHDDKGTYPTIRAVVSTKGRLFYMVDETRSSIRTVPSTWFLVARDGFSGVLLWKKTLQAASYKRRLEQVWRSIIADGDLVYAPLGTDQPLSVLDGATGTLNRSYDGTDGFEEVVKDNGILFMISQHREILALHADTGSMLWRWKPPEADAIVPLTLAVSESKVFIKTEESVYCLSAMDGTKVWGVDLEGSKKKQRLRWPREKLLVRNGVVLCSYAGKDPKDLNRDKFAFLGSHPRVHDYDGKLAALSTDDGRILWRADYLPGLESTPGEIYISGGQVWLGPDFSRPRELSTGEVKRNRPVLERLWTTGHHYRCYPGKATSRYIMTAKRGIELIDLNGENHSRNNWVRATCRVGVTPCNGLLYAPPHSCGCYMEAMLSGFWALASSRSGSSSPADMKLAAEASRLRQGLAFGNTGSMPSLSGWLTYRGDESRSGSTNAMVPPNLEQLWSTKIGGHLSALTVADGNVFVAQIDAHTVHALDSHSGKSRWHYTAGSRIDSPPTIYRGLVLFGSRDGWVYCLRESDGALVWRFLAAPLERYGVAYGHIESLWPVHGSVLVKNDIAYVAAGRSSYLDDGIMLYGLQPETGEVLFTTRLKSQHAGVSNPPPENERSTMRAKISQNNTDYKTFLAPDRSDAFSMHGARTDVLVAVGDAIFMRHRHFNGKLVEQEQKLPHLFSTSSLLDDTEHNRSYWLLGTGDFSRTPVAYPWIVAKSLAVPYGLMLTFDNQAVWGVHRRQKKDGYVLFRVPRPDPSAAKSLLPDFAQRSGKKSTIGLSWSAELSMRPRAILRAGEMIFVGGGMSSSSSLGGITRRGISIEHDDQGLVRIFSCEKGAVLGEAQLDAPPVWDGMAAVSARLYVSQKDGSVMCLGRSAKADTER